MKEEKSIMEKTCGSSRWVAYIFKRDFPKQKEIIKVLKPVIKDFEGKGYIRGFNYNYTYSKEPREPDHLSVRLEFSDHQKEKLFENKIKSLNLSWDHKQDYTEEEKIKKAYEMGSRWAFLFINLAENGKINEKLLEDNKFLKYMIHGLCNSLGLSYDVEQQFIHFELYRNLNRERLSKKVRIDFRACVSKFNDYIKEGALETIYKGLINLSQNLCKENLDKEFPRVDNEGKMLSNPLENLMWASALILAAWLGWRFQSKAIWHYGKSHPQEEIIILRNYVIPSIIEAFEQGITKAINDKRKEKFNENKIMIAPKN